MNRVLVTNDYRTVLSMSGFDAWYHCLPPKLGIDQFRSTLPLMVKDDQHEAVIVAKEIDRTNLESISKPGVRFVFHTPYFTFDRLEHPSDARPDLPTAVGELVDSNAYLDPLVPVALWQELKGRLGLATWPDHRDFVPPLNLYKVPRSKVTETANIAHDLGARAAQPYVEYLRASDLLKHWLSAPLDDRLSSLDRLMAQNDIDAIFASTPINIQELSGIPSTLVGEDVWALYEREASYVYIFSRRELPWFGLPESKPLGSSPVIEIAKGNIGYEELDLTISAFEGFDLSKVATKPASLLLRRWREQRSWEDLAFYVLGAQLTIHAIEAALALVNESQTDGGYVTELDAYERYRDSVTNEIHEHQLPIRVRTYFTHAFAGSRSLLPSRPTEYSLEHLTSFKIDAGIEVYDYHGSLRAVSDITRTALGTSDAMDAYHVLEQILVEEVIPRCQPGVSGEEVFIAGADAIEPYLKGLLSYGLYSDSSVAFRDVFGRDIGHLLGKQEPATVVFQKGNHEVFEPGMVAAAELQWPYHDFCIGVEDVFMTTESASVNLTRCNGE